MRREAIGLLSMMCVMAACEGEQAATPPAAVSPAAAAPPQATRLSMRWIGADQSPLLHDVVPTPHGEGGGPHLCLLGERGVTDYVTAKRFREAVPYTLGCHVEARDKEGRGEAVTVTWSVEGAQRGRLVVPGGTEKLRGDLAFGKLAVVSWREAPRLTVYELATGEERWSAALEGAEPPLTVGWHPTGELTVEWETRAPHQLSAMGVRPTLSRVAFDGEGRALGRERLDERVFAALREPVAYLLAPAQLRADEHIQLPVSPSAGYTILERGQPTRQYEPYCLQHKLETRTAQALSLGSGRAMVVEALHPEGGPSSALTATNARCASVTMLEVPGGRLLGRWGSAQ